MINKEKNNKEKFIFIISLLLIIASCSIKSIFAETHVFKSGVSHDTLIYHKEGVKNASEGKFKEAEEQFKKILERNRFDDSARDLLRMLKDFYRGKISQEYLLYLFKGLDFLNNKAYEEAIKELQKAITVTPDYPMSYISLAWAHVYSGQIQQGIIFCNKAIKIDPNFIDAYVSLGSIYLFLGQPQQSIVYFKKAIEKDSNYVRAYIHLGMLYQSLHQFKEARDNFQRAKEVFQQKKDNQGVESIRQLLSMSLKDALYFYYRNGILDASKGKFKEAEEHFKNVLLIDNLDYESINSLKTLNDLKKGEINQEYAIYVFKGLNYWQDEAYQEAIQELKRAIKIIPNHDRGYSTLGSVYFVSDQPKEAITYYKKTLEVNPNYSLAYYNLGVAYDSLGQPKQAIAFYQRAIELDSNYAPSYNNLGVIYRRIGELQKAVTYLQKAIEIKPNFYDDPYVNLGNTYADLNKNQEAITCYEKAIEVDPFDVSGYFDLGVLYYNLDQFEQAIPYYEKIIELKPSDASACNNLAQALEGLKQYKEARANYEKAIQIDSKYAAPYLGLARIQYDLGDYKQMRENRLKAKNLYRSQKNFKKVKEIEIWIKNFP